MQETFVKDADSYTGKFTVPKMDNFFRGGTYGVVFTEGELWRDQRRFALSVLRNFGMGRNLMEQKILDEIVAFTETLSEDVNAQSCDLPWRFEVCIGSIINAMLFGYRFEGEKLNEFKFFKNLLSDHMHSMVNPCIAILAQELDLLKYVFRGSYKLLDRNRKLFFDFFNRQIEEHEKELDLDSLDEPTDFVEAYLREMYLAEKSGGNGNQTYFTKKQLANMCLDLWFAGMETTANTLEFTVLYLIRNPTVMKKVHEELDRVIGTSRLITLKDKCNLPYLQATINESQRMANLLPLNLLHKTTRDVTILGHFIPKNTCIVPQIGNVLFNEQIFPEPEKFKPERFLTENGELKKIEEFCPFSIGKRQCLGESLAKMELFLILANLFNQFEIFPEDPKHLPTLRRVPGITWQPTHYKVRIEKRHV
uniref:Cytochrome P450 n=1 Tax=Panagrolaimus sp. ES5 TaxID=591445 RepID=A0AC34F7R8_9BILA